MREQWEFDSLFRTCYTQLLIYALQYLKDREEADDAVTAAFEDLWQHFDTVEANTAKAYLFVSTKNLCIDTLRRRRCHERYLQFVQGTEQHSREALADPDRAFKEGVVAQVFEKLKPPTSEILRACYVEEKKYKQVAQEMNISVSTVRKHIIKALKIVREMRKNIN